KQMAPNLESINITGCPACKQEDDLKQDQSVNIINKNRMTSPKRDITTAEKSIKQVGKGENKKTRSIDSDVLNKDTEYDLTEIFTDVQGGASPPVNQYRLSVFNKIQFTPNPSCPFDLLNEGALDLKPYKNYQY